MMNFKVREKGEKKWHNIYARNKEEAAILFTLKNKEDKMIPIDKRKKFIFAQTPQPTLKPYENRFENELKERHKGVLGMISEEAEEFFGSNYIKHSLKKEHEEHEKHKKR